MRHVTRSHIVIALAIILVLLAACYAPITLLGAAAYLVLARLAQLFLRTNKYTPASRALRRSQRRLLIAKED